MAGSATIVDLVQTSRLPHRRSRKSHHLVRLRLHQLQVDLRRRRDDGSNHLRSGHGAEIYRLSVRRGRQEAVQPLDPAVGRRVNEWYYTLFKLMP
jgi:hypothetical protein